MSTNGIAEERPSLPPTEQPPTAQPQADIEALRSKVTDLEEQARTLIRERPVVAVLAAVGIGYLVARLASRGSR